MLQAHTLDRYCTSLCHSLVLKFITEREVIACLSYPLLQQLTRIFILIKTNEVIFTCFYQWAFDQAGVLDHQPDGLSLTGNSILLFFT
jgi:hypothetical protein